MKDIDRVVRHLHDKYSGNTSADNSIYERGMLDNSLAKPRAEYPLVAPPPRQMKIEMTNNCNQRCIYCPSRLMRRGKGLIDADLTRRVIREARELAIGEIGFYTTGESLLHPQLPEMIRYAKEQNIPYTFLDTNGAMLTPARAAALMDAGLDSLKYSCSAGTRETYRTIHGCDDFDRVLEHMRATHALRAARGVRKPHLAISYIVSRDNEAEIPRLRELAGPYVDEILFLPMNNIAGQVPAEAKERQLSEFEEFETDYVPCQYLWSKVIVTWEGLLTICPVDFENQLVYGDLQRETLASAWNNERMQEFRRRIRDGVLDDLVCARCLF